MPGVIKNIMEIEGKGRPASLRLYPRNTPEILINLANPLHGQIKNHTLIVDGTTIQGSKKSYIEVEHPRFCHFLSIRFTSNGFYKLFGIPQTEFTNHLFQLDDVTDDPDQLIVTLKNTPTSRKKFQYILLWLQRLISNTDIPSDLLSDFIIDQLSREPNLTVNQLVEKTGFTRKHLAQRFKAEAGLTIKEYQKISRIYRILKQVEDERSPSWTKLACQFGFYDQSHLIRDFRRFTGYTPTEFSRTEPYENTKSV